MVKLSVLQALLFAASHTALLSVQAESQGVPTGHAAPYAKCTGKLKVKDGPGGFGNTYKIANRAPPKFQPAEGQTPAMAFNLPGSNKLVTFNLEKIPYNRGNERRIQYNLKLYNEDKISHYARIAWSKDKNSEPFYIFTIEAQPGDDPAEGCVEVGAGVPFYFTAQSF